MKVGDVVQLIKPCDEHVHRINCYGIVIELYTRCHDDFIKVRLLKIIPLDVSTIHDATYFHNTISCYQYRFAEVL